MKQPPVQQIPADVPLQVISLQELNSPASFEPHRHSFYMLFWVRAGRGSHRIAYLSHELLPGRLFFSHQGQVHQVDTYPDEGWLILFNPAVYRSFIGRYPALGYLGLFDEFSRKPFVDLDEKTAALFAQLVPLLAERSREQPNDNGLIDYLSILLYEASRLSSGTQASVLHPRQAGMVRKLKSLIEKHYRSERNAPFYADQLGLPARKLNEITLELYGQYVHDMINDRILSEAERLLGGTTLHVKEITYELGFIDSSHFGVFFKRHKGITAGAFRNLSKR